MQNDTPLTDDFVAELLRKDAVAVSSRTAAEFGLGNRRPPGSVARPNTRFLRNIIRDVDSHNAALRDKEVEGSRGRFEAVQSKKRPARAAQEVYSVPARRGEGSGPASKRRRLEGDVNKRRSSTRHHVRRDINQEPQQDERAPQDSRHAQRSGHERNNDGSRRNRPESPREDKPRTLTIGLSVDRRDASSNYKQRSPPIREAGESSSEGRRVRGRPIKVSYERASQSRSHRSDPDDTGFDAGASDCSSSLGPRRASQSPPIQQRGRGTKASGVSMNEHFSESYDPSLEVRLPEDGDVDDWDQALEALRDRQKWKKSGAERFKSAGFTDDEIERSMGRVKTGVVMDVQWAKAGEGREWDRGKANLE